MTTVVYCGDDKTLTFTVTSSGAAYSLVGLLGATCLLKENAADSDDVAIMTKTLSDMTVTDAAGGVLTVPMDAADTEAYPGGSPLLSLKLKDALGMTSTVYDGAFPLTRPGVRKVK